MLALLLAAGIAATPPAALYEADSLYVFAAVANDRIIDGLSYTDNGGVLSAGLLYAKPSGFFANAELIGLRGTGRLLPDDSLLLLESAIGWQLGVGRHTASLSLFDYRLHGEQTHASQGIALNYRAGGLTLEAGIERDRRYFTYGGYGGFYEYDLRRTAASWSAPLTATLHWQLGGGVVDFEDSDGRQEFVSTGLTGQWRGFEWQLSLSHSRLEASAFTATEADGTHLLLRLARSARLR